MTQHRYRVGQVCVFTNRGSSGVTENDGEKCRITSLKPRRTWINNEPGYSIEFLDRNHGFGVRECELEAVE